VTDPSSFDPARFINRTRPRLHHRRAEPSAAAARVVAGGLAVSVPPPCRPCGVPGAVSASDKVRVGRAGKDYSEHRERSWSGRTGPRTSTWTTRTRTSGPPRRLRESRPASRSSTRGRQRQQRLVHQGRPVTCVKGADTGYDLMYVSDTCSPSTARYNYIQKLDSRNIPNHRNILPRTPCAPARTRAAASSVPWAVRLHPHRVQHHLVKKRSPRGPTCSRRSDLKGKVACLPRWRNTIAAALLAIWPQHPAKFTRRTVQDALDYVRRRRTAASSVLHRQTTT